MVKLRAQAVLIVPWTFSSLKSEGVVVMGGPFVYILNGSQWKPYTVFSYIKRCVGGFCCCCFLFVLIHQFE